MFRNLRETLRRKGMSMKTFAEFLEVSESAAQNKVHGKTAFTYPEFKKICNFLLPEYNAEWLFKEFNKDDQSKYSA